MKRILIAGLVISALALAIATNHRTAQADPPHAMCPMCAGEMGPGMGMGMGPGMGQGMGMGHPGMGMAMMAPLMDAKTTVKQTATSDGVTITLSNPDKTTAQQLQRMAQIMTLQHEMMRTQMQQMHAAGAPAK